MFLHFAFDPTIYTNLSSWHYRDINNAKTKKKGGVKISTKIGNMPLFFSRLYMNCIVSYLLKTGFIQIVIEAQSI